MGHVAVGTPRSTVLDPRWRARQFCPNGALPEHQGVVTAGYCDVQVQWGPLPFGSGRSTQWFRPLVQVMTDRFPHLGYPNHRPSPRSCRLATTRTYLTRRYSTGIGY